MGASTISPLPLSATAATTDAASTDGAATPVAQAPKKPVSAKAAASPPVPYQDVDVDRVLAALPHRLQSALTRPLRALPVQAPAVQQALTMLEAATTTSKGHYAVTSALLGAGCMFQAPPTQGYEPLALHGDPVAALAARAKADAPDNAAAVAAFASRVGAAGLLATDEWQFKPELSNRRGVLGEVLRLLQIDDEGQPVEVIRGLFAIEQPAALLAATTPHEAKLIAEEHGFKGVYRYLDAAGEVRFGLLQTEVDVVVGTQSEQGFVPQRFENVKAGVGSASTARKQNERAHQVLRSETGVFARMHEGTPVELKLVREPEVADALVCTTVGPLEDSDYDAALPLSTHDIVVLAKRLAV